MIVTLISRQQMLHLPRNLMTFQQETQSRIGNSVVYRRRASRISRPFEVRRPA